MDIFRIKERKIPSTITVELITPAGKRGKYLLSQLTRRQTLQIKLTRIKNNTLRISRYPVKLRYFAHPF